MECPVKVAESRNIRVIPGLIRNPGAVLDSRLRGSDAKCRRADSKGFTLIEIIVFIVVAGVFVPLAYVAFSNAVKESTRPEAIITARYIAERQMEGLTKYPFGSIPTSCPLPCDTNYTCTCTVGFVTYTGTRPTLTIVDSATATKYKKIIVNVREPQGYDYKVYTIVTDKT